MVKEWLGCRYSKHEVNLGIAFFNEGTFNITSSISQCQRYIGGTSNLVAPGKEHKKGFPEVPIEGFRNDKSLKDYLVTAALPKLEALNNVERVLVNCAII